MAASFVRHLINQIVPDERMNPGDVDTAVVSGWPNKNARHPIGSIKRNVETRKEGGNENQESIFAR